MSRVDPDSLVDELLSSFGRVALWAMTNAGNDAAILSEIGRFGDMLSEVLSKEDGHDALRALLRYILATHEHIDRGALREAVSETIGAKAEEDVVTVYDQLIEEGRQELFLEALAMKFGRVPAAIRARVRGASPAELRAWLKAMLTASTLDSVFGTPPARGRAARAATKAPASPKKLSAR